MKEWIKELYQYALGALVVLSFVAIVVLMIVLQPSSDDVLNTIVGVLGTITVMVVGYFFGSSKGSADKNKMIDKK